MKKSNQLPVYLTKNIKRNTKKLLNIDKIIKKNVVSMSHPNGYFFANSYNGLKNKKFDMLNIPRIDHSSLIK